LPIISCGMTDRDVVEQVATAFGTSVRVIRKARYRDEFRAVAKGARAVRLMTDLKPLMGDRRRTAIGRALEAHAPSTRKLSFGTAEEIRRRHWSGETAAALARAFGVTHPTIRAILTREIYSRPEPAPWRSSENDFSSAVVPSEFSTAEFLWLAGWLEGEGSFLAPPPSSPRGARIQAQARDRDVVDEVARLLDVRVGLHIDRRNPAWSPMWRVLLQWGRAVRLMKMLQPIMGARRANQIQAALEATNEATGRSAKRTISHAA
jgi:hypothetical protein